MNIKLLNGSVEKNTLLQITELKTYFFDTKK